MRGDRSCTACTSAPGPSKSRHTLARAWQSHPGEIQGANGKDMHSHQAYFEKTTCLFIELAISKRLLNHVLID